MAMATAAGSDLEERLRLSNIRFVASINRILERVRAALARRPGRWPGLPSPS